MPGLKFKDLLNQSNPNKVASLLEKLDLGNVLRALPARLTKAVPALSPFQLGTLQSFTLPDDAKASFIFRAYSRAATAGSGELTIVAYGTTPATGQIAVAPNGDIVVLAADAHLSVDIEYLPMYYDVLELSQVNVVSDAVVLPTTVTPLLLLEAEALVGTAPGKKIILTPGASPAAGRARINAAKTQVLFNSTDAITSAKLKLAVAPATDLNALLPSPAEF
jgi:hypothetical protein